MAFTRYGAEIAAIVGLFTIAGFLWKIFKSLGATMRVVVTLPAQVSETKTEVKSVASLVDSVDRKVDLMTAEHLATKEQLNTGIRDLKSAHEQFDVRLRGVEQNVAIRRDRDEHAIRRDRDEQAVQRDRDEQAVRRNREEHPREP